MNLLLRRRMLMEQSQSPSAPSPVMDGLLLWIDGQDTPVFTWNAGHTAISSAVFNNRADNSTVTMTSVNSDTQAGQEGNFITLWDKRANGTLCTCTFSNPITSQVLSTEITISANFGDYVINRSHFGNLLKYYTSFYYPATSFAADKTFVNSTEVGTGLTTGHIVGTRDTNNKVYLNGSLLRQGTVAFTSVSGMSFGILSTSPVYVGSIRFYNRSLTPEEVQQNYQYEKSMGRVL